MSKVERGQDLLADLDMEPKEVILIGDTAHDYEVSKEIGCDCLLISNGHQSYQRISNCHTSIIETISDLIDFIKREAMHNGKGYQSIVQHITFAKGGAMIKDAKKAANFY